MSGTLTTPAGIGIVAAGGRERSFAGWLWRGSGAEVDIAVLVIQLLTFQVTRVDDALDVDLRAVSLADARRKLAIRSTSLRTSSYTLQYHLKVYPRS